MKWFKHDSDASSDAKIRKLIMRHGAVGYAVYFHCLELIAGNVSNDNITFDQFCDLHRNDLMDYFDTEPEITKEWYVYMGVLRPLWLTVRVYNHSL